MPNTANLTYRFCGARALFLCPLLGIILLSCPAAAETAYPVGGVFAAIDPNFPNAEFEVCMSVRTFGIEAVSKKAIAELIIFTKDKRHDLKGDIETVTTIKTIKSVAGRFQITETFNKSRGWIGIRRKTEYDMKVIGPNTIEIWDGKTISRYARCTSSRRIWI